MPSSNASLPAAPGSSQYLSSLLNRVRKTHPALPLDPVVLQTLLLCLVARIPAFAEGHCAAPTTEHLHGAKPEIHTEHGCTGGACFNLILRTREEDVGMLVHVVSLILTTVFGIHAHKHSFPTPKKVKSRGKQRADPAQFAHPNDLLRTLFLHKSVSRHHISRTSTGSRPPSISAAMQQRTGVLHTSPLRPPLDLGSELRIDLDADPRDYFDNMSIASSRRPLHMTNPTSTMRSRALQRPPSERLRTDPLPLVTAFKAVDTHKGPMSSSIGKTGTSPQSSDTVLPRAVVVSGLEHAGKPLQRALLQVLAERRLVLENDGQDGSQDQDQEEGTWNLPDNFMMVYVCKCDPHERPGLLFGLLDKFAMSADVTLNATTRQAYAAYRTSTPTSHNSLSPRTASIPLDPSTPVPVTPHLRPSSTLVPPPPNNPPAIPASELAALRELASPYSSLAAAHTAMRPTLHMYMCDLFAATRHHPALDGALLTRRAHADAAALTRALRVLAGDTGGTMLLRALAAEREGIEATTDSMGTSLGTSTDTSTSDAGSSWGKDELGLGLGWQEAKRGGVPEGVDLSMDIDVDVKPAEEHQVAPSASPKAWDVSEVDVAKVFPRVVSHRVRAREGPADEVLGSVMWPAVLLTEPDTEAAAWVRKSVKEILVEILADV